MTKRLLFRTCYAVLLVLFTSISTHASVTVNSTNFPDAYFRSALASYATNGIIDETTLTELDVSSQGISNLTGLQLLTGLVTLDISNNTLTTGANLTGLTSLTTLKATSCNLYTLAATSEGSYAGLILGTGNSSIKYLDLSSNEHFYKSGNLQYLTNLETFLLKSCTYYDGWSATVGNALTKLKYLDASHCDLNFVSLAGPSTLEHFDVSFNTKLVGISSTDASSSNHFIKLNSNLSNLKYVDVSNCTNLDRLYLNSATNLVHLDAAGTKIKGFQSSNTEAQHYITLSSTLGNNGTLKYLNLSNCSSLTSFRALAEYYKVKSLDTLILTNDTNLGWSNVGFEAQTGLRYLDVTNCAISTTGSFIPSFDNLKNLETLLYGENPAVGYLRITGNSNLKTLDLHNNTGLTMLALDNCGLPRNDISINDTNCPAFTGLKLNNNGYSSVSQAVSNYTSWGLDNIEFLYLKNNSGFNGGAFTMTASDCGNLKGLDLGNNGFTSFNAPSLPSTLTALMIGNNPSMERLEMHNNPGISRS